MVKCKGIFFQAKKSNYIDDSFSIHTKISLNFLKDKSCTGCSECIWFWNFIYKDIEVLSYSNDIVPYLNNNDIECGKIYTPVPYYPLSMGVLHIDFKEVI